MYWKLVMIEEFTSHFGEVRHDQVSEENLRSSLNTDLRLRDFPTVRETLWSNARGSSDS